MALLFAELLEDWLSSRVIDTRPKTAEWYSQMARHLAPLADLDVDAIPGDLAAIREATRRINGVLAGLVKEGKSATARGVQRTISGVLASVGIKLTGVRVPRAGEIAQRGFWTPQQAGAFLRHVSEHRLVAAWALALVGGMRRGELCGLLWRDVDLDGAVIHIRRQRTPLNRGGVYVGPPKGTSQRNLPIGPALVAMLRARRAAYETERRMAYRRWRGPQDDNDGFVFGHLNGLPYYPGWFSVTWGRLCREAGVPEIPLHGARHTSATVGVVAGVDIKTMQARLGHSSPDILTRTYLHLVTDQARAAAAVMEDAVGVPHIDQSPTVMVG